MLEVPGDQALHVIHAPSGVRRALIYLHGWCGRVEAADTWKHAAAAHGTLIGLRAEIECPNGRSRWGKDTDEQHERIQRALGVVKSRRAGLLDTSDLVLVGYSQGAARAFRLAQRYPKIYARLVLGGPPEPPSLAFLGKARALAVLGGERETTERMRAGTANLQQAGRLARYFMLPAAKHGEYGPEAERVMDNVLSWLVRVAP